MKSQTYKIRQRERLDRWAGQGLSKMWTEWQVVLGRKVLFRAGTEAEAKAWIDQQLPHYFTWSHNIDESLKNGSYVRQDPDGIIVQYMNGDYMGELSRVPNGMTEVDTKHARSLLPKCCK